MDISSQIQRFFGSAAGQWILYATSRAQADLLTLAVDGDASAVQRPINGCPEYSGQEFR